MTNQLAIEIRGLSHSYGTRAALQDVSFQVARGTIFGLLGPNGGGKTTLFRILSTLLRPQTGTVRILGDDVASSPHQIRRRIGVVFQAQSVDRQLTLLENLRHQGHLYGFQGKALRKRAEAMLARLGLADRKNNRAETLSGGLRRRLELAKGLLHQPEVLLLDEPSTGLDASARRDLRLYLSQLREEFGVTILLTTHFMNEAEACDCLGILDRGRLVALDSPAALKETIGGDVLVLETREPETLSRRIQERFGGDPKIVGGMVRLERPQAHVFVTDLVEAFPGQIDSVTLSKPTLEDVFIQRTGHQFWHGTQESK
jgi:ABC-2 type transport system ATP-binding protein